MAFSLDRFFSVLMRNLIISVKKTKCGTNLFQNSFCFWNLYILRNGHDIVTNHWMIKKRKKRNQLVTRIFRKIHNLHTITTYLSNTYNIYMGIFIHLFFVRKHRISVCRIFSNFSVFHLVCNISIIISSSCVSDYRFSTNISISILFLINFIEVSSCFDRKYMAVHLTAQTKHVQSTTFFAFWTLLLAQHKQFVYLYRFRWVFFFLSLSIVFFHFIALNSAKLLIWLLTYLFRLESGLFFLISLSLILTHKGNVFLCCLSKHLIFLVSDPGDLCVFVFETMKSTKNVWILLIAIKNANVYICNFLAFIWFVCTFRNICNGI